MDLYEPIVVDQKVHWLPGKAERLAHKGKLPHVKLITGEIRFRPEDIAAIAGESPGSERLMSLATLAKCLSLPDEWLEQEAATGRLPSLVVSGVRVFSLSSVLMGLVRRAITSGANDPVIEALFRERRQGVAS